VRHCSVSMCPGCPICHQVPVSFGRYGFLSR
jgi:hypothetical protein